MLPPITETPKKHCCMLYLIVCIAGLGGFLFGYDTGVISGAILFINQEFALSTFHTSSLVSALLFGACVSAATSGRFADYFGRRRLLVIDAILYILGTLGSSAASSLFGLIVARLVVGLAVGISSYVVPLYISEIAPFKKRGIMVGFNQLFIVSGILVSYFVDYHFATGGHWRWMLGVGVIPAIGFLVGMLLAPESPRWLIANGKESQASEVLQSARAVPNVEIEIVEIRQSIYEQRDDWRMFFKSWLIPAAIVGFGLGAFQQLVGVNIFIYYGPSILQMAGFTQAAGAILATLGMGLILMIFTIISLPLIDGWGRRPLLLVSASGMTISFLIKGIGYGFLLVGAYWFKWLMLFGTILYIASFAIGFGPIAWLMISEMFPLRIRGLAASLATATIWGFDLLVIFTFLPLLHLLNQSGIFLLYALFSLLSLLFVYYLVPETKGITLEHIETNLRLGKRCRSLGA
jgi:MFS transporter, SP family, galactose:H+ symporter